MFKLLIINTLFVLLSFSASFFSCVEKPTQPTIPSEKFSQILADLAVAEAATAGLSGQPKDTLAQFYYKQVFEMHGVSREEYEQNIRIFAQDEIRMGEILKASEKLLKEKQTSAGGVK